MRQVWTEVTAAIGGVAVAFERLTLSFGRTHRVLDDFYAAEGYSRSLARPRHERRVEPAPTVRVPRSAVRLPRQGLGWSGRRAPLPRSQKAT